MKHPKLKALVAALVLAGVAPAGLAQQAGGQEMDHSQHMMQPAPAAQPQQNAYGVPARRGAQAPGKPTAGMGGMDHDTGGGMGCGMMGGKGGGMGGGKMGGMGGGMMG